MNIAEWGRQGGMQRRVRTPGRQEVQHGGERRAPTGSVPPKVASSGAGPIRVPAHEGKGLEQWIQEAREAAERWKPGAILGRGDTGRPVLLAVGKAPGAVEVRRGAPFTGRSGKVLEEMLERLGLSLEEGGGAYATNASLWFAETGERPSTAETESTVPVLEGMVRCARPRVLLALGREGAEALTAVSRSVGGARGRWIKARWNGVEAEVRVTYHPAYLLRNEEGWRDVHADLDEVGRRLDQGRVAIS